MKMQNKRYIILYFVLALAPLVYLTSIYKTLPYEIPATFGFNGTPINFGNKVSLAIIDMIPLACAYIATYIGQVAYRESKNSRNIFTLLNIQVLLIVLIDVIIIQYNFAIVEYINNGSKNNSLVVFATLLIFFVPLGLAMGNLEPNNYIGIKTPFTLKYEKNWKYTHKFTQYFWFVGGIVSTIVFILYSSIIIFISAIILLIGIPHLFSAILYSKNKKRK